MCCLVCTVDVDARTGSGQRLTLQASSARNLYGVEQPWAGVAFGTAGPRRNPLVMAARNKARSPGSAVIRQSTTVLTSASYLRQSNQLTILRSGKRERVAAEKTSASQAALMADSVAPPPPGR